MLSNCCSHFSTTSPSQTPQWRLTAWMLAGKRWCKTCHQGIPPWTFRGSDSRSLLKYRHVSMCLCSSSPVAPSLRLSICSSHHLLKSSWATLPFHLQSVSPDHLHLSVCTVPPIPNHHTPHHPATPAFDLSLYFLGTLWIHSSLSS